MARTLYWMQCGACGGDSMALLGAPDLLACLADLEMEILWHPSLSTISPERHRVLLEEILSGDRALDVLCVEGAVIRGPSGTGMFNSFMGRPKKDLLARLARRAGHVVAIGTCASFGGMGASGAAEATGLQFLKAQRGGFLGETFTGAAGLPVVNLPGCPVHAEIVVGALTALCTGVGLALNEYQAPLEWYGHLVHQGCVRNEYHEYRVEDHQFGGRGCLFFHLGCRGPLTYGACNRLGQGSKTRAGVPCVGCTHPEFPQPHPFFQTRNIAGIPLDLPAGVDRAHYLAYKSMAAAAAPERLKERQTRV